MANSSEAANKCRLWGLEWNSPREATLVQEITEELQMCLREMIESQQDARLLPNYLIGGEKKMSPSGGFTWKWKSGRKIALRGEVKLCLVDIYLSGVREKGVDSYVQSAVERGLTKKDKTVYKILKLTALFSINYKNKSALLQREKHSTIYLKNTILLLRKF